MYACVEFSGLSPLDFFEDGDREGGVGGGDGDDDDDDDDANVDRIVKDKTPGDRARQTANIVANR
jgi:hypothetical protein